MSQKPIVSIIIPVYNVERWVERALRSAMNQSFVDIEIICVNDGSKDKSWEIVESIACEDARVRLINYQENHGQSFARNRGMEKAQGKYILFVDSDDALKNDAVELLYRSVEKDSCDLIFFGFEFHYETEFAKEKYYALVIICMMV